MLSHIDFTNIIINHPYPYGESKETHLHIQASTRNTVEQHNSYQKRTYLDDIDNRGANNWLEIVRENHGTRRDTESIITLESTRLWRSYFVQALTRMTTTVCCGWTRENPKPF